MHAHVYRLDETGAGVLSATYIWGGGLLLINHERATVRVMMRAP